MCQEKDAIRNLNTLSILFIDLHAHTTSYRLLPLPIRPIPRIHRAVQIATTAGTPCDSHTGHSTLNYSIHRVFGCILDTTRAGLEVMAAPSWDGCTDERGLPPERLEW